MENHFKFSLSQVVIIAGGNEKGTIIGRAEYTYCEPSYLIRYIAGDGRAVEAWWTETALVAM